MPNPDHPCRNPIQGLPRQTPARAKPSPAPHGQQTTRTGPDDGAGTHANRGGGTSTPPGHPPKTRGGHTRGAVWQPAGPAPPSTNAGDSQSSAKANKTASHTAQAAEPHSTTTKAADPTAPNQTTSSPTASADKTPSTTDAYSADAATNHAATANAQQPDNTSKPSTSPNN